MPVNLAVFALALRVALPPQGAPRPRLVVVISVDQMRADYLDRFAPLFRGGFARLLHEGTVFTEARHDHSGTETSPGHATLSTGTFPSHSGIVANNWYDRTEARVVYSVDDSSVSIAGHPKEMGRSPKRLLTDALGDWVKRASPQSKVISVAIKDRAAILMGGHHPDAAYWYNTSDGTYQSSSYYMKQLPGWVDSFNAAKPADRHMKEGWTLSRPPEAYAASGPDSVPEEGDGVHVAFPHRLENPGAGPTAESYYELIYTPFGDELTLDFAKDAVVREQLGADSIPDVLWVGCSAGDYVGHRYGPSSWEIEDYYLRLDEYLGDFFKFLDENVGAGRYVVALSGDHGVMPLPEVLEREGKKAQRLTRSEASLGFQKVEAEVVKELGVSRPIFAGYVEGFLLHKTAASAKQVPPAKLQSTVTAKLRELQFVADAFTADELAKGTGSKREYFQLFQHSFYAGRSPDVVIRFQPYVLFTDSDVKLGTSHGTVYDYDRRVPLVFMGDGVKAAKRTEQVRTVDLAPTLSRLIGIAPPASVDGRALLN